MAKKKTGYGLYVIAAVVLIVAVAIMFYSSGTFGQAVKLGKYKVKVNCVFDYLPGTTDAQMIMNTCRDDRWGHSCSGVRDCSFNFEEKYGQNFHVSSSCGGAGHDARVDGRGREFHFTCGSVVKVLPTVEEGLVKESVKCEFAGSQKEASCYSENGKCSGAEVCIVDVVGKKGEKITWKSSCGGYAYTTMDGRNEPAKFNCASGIPLAEPESEVRAEEREGIVTEQVLCYFKNSGGVIKCVPSGFSDGCQAYSPPVCIADVKGPRGSKVLWKSACGETITVIDGKVKLAIFECPAQPAAPTPTGPGSPGGAGPAPIMPYPVMPGESPGSAPIPSMPVIGS